MMKSKKIKESRNSSSVFDINADDWWNESGAFKPLHSFNLVRIKFLRDSLNLSSDDSLEKLRILDVGCGGGIFCEPLSRLGANVLGIDSNKKAIVSAKAHAKKSKLKINYINTKIEKINPEHKFDVISCMEVLEHVDDVKIILKNIRKNLKPGGIFIGSTINKSIPSFLAAILIAENILKIVPKKTHEWNKFIKPNYLKKELISENFSSIYFNGLIYNPIFNIWSFRESLSINYIFSAKLL